MAKENDIRARRRSLRLTQQDMAVLLDITRVTYIKWEENPELIPVGKYNLLMDQFKKLEKLRRSVDGME